MSDQPTALCSACSTYHAEWHTVKGVEQARAEGFAEGMKQGVQKALNVLRSEDMEKARDAVIHHLIQPGDDEPAVPEGGRMDDDWVPRVQRNAVVEAKRSGYAEGDAHGIQQCLNELNDIANTFEDGSARRAVRKAVGLAFQRLVSPPSDLPTGPNLGDGKREDHGVSEERFCALGRAVSTLFAAMPSPLGGNAITYIGGQLAIAFPPADRAE